MKDEGPVMKNEEYLLKNGLYRPSNEEWGILAKEGFIRNDEGPVLKNEEC